MIIGRVCHKTCWAIAYGWAVRDSNRQRGRPPVGDQDDIRTRAIEVILRLGYEQTTMSQIAGELGLSVRTLHRYFPSKSDIVWGGIEGAIDALRRGFAGVDPGLPVLAAVKTATLAAFAEDREGVALSRARFQVIASTPGLESTRPETYRLWREETVAFIARRIGVPHDNLQARATGAAVHSAVMTSLSWWAEQEDHGTPADAVAKALDGLAETLTM